MKAIGKIELNTLSTNTDWGNLSAVRVSEPLIRLETPTPMSLALLASLSLLTGCGSGLCEVD